MDYSKGVMKIPARSLIVGDDVLKVFGQDVNLGKTFFWFFLIIPLFLDLIIASVSNKS